MSAGTPRILVADDEPALAEYLRARIAALWPGACVLPVARNGIEALASIRENEPDAAFLDIRMPGLTGLELAARVGTSTHVVFVTAYDVYAVEAFDRNAVDYLVKPVADERLVRAIDRLKTKIAAREAPPGIGEVLARIAAALPGGAGYLRWVRALRGDEVHQIAIEDVLYFQAQDKYTCVITRDGESLIRTALSELSGQLDPPRSRRCTGHRRQHELRGLHAARPRRSRVRAPQGRAPHRAARFARLRTPLPADVTGRAETGGREAR